MSKYFTRSEPSDAHAVAELAWKELLDLSWSAATLTLSLNGLLLDGATRLPAGLIGRVPNHPERAYRLNSVSPIYAGSVDYLMTRSFLRSQLDVSRALLNELASRDGPIEFDSLERATYAWRGVCDHALEFTETVAEIQSSLSVSPRFVSEELERHLFRGCRGLRSEAGDERDVAADPEEFDEPVRLCHSSSSAGDRHLTITGIEGTKYLLDRAEGLAAGDDVEIVLSTGERVAGNISWVAGTRALMAANSSRATPQKRNILF